LIVVVALLVSGLRLVCRSWTLAPQLLEKISAISGSPVNASQLTPAGKILARRSTCAMSPRA
jgi:uncharacterized protein YhdP